MNELIEVFKNLEGKNIEPNIIRQTLDSINFSRINYQDDIQPNMLDDYNRRMVMESPVQMYLMVWQPQFFYPIHQHNNFWGFVVPLQGILSETIYGFAPNKKKVYIHPTKIFKQGEIIYEPYNVIHKLQNTSPIDQLVTLHIYFPPAYNFKDTTIFDAKNRTLAVLSEKAMTISWDLPEDNYLLIEEDAYDLEKLW